jgi:hypothetical protein
MSFTQKLGTSYAEAKDKVKIRIIKIDLDDVSFNLKVRIPLKKEMEELVEKISNPPKELVDKIYDQFTAPLLKTIKEGGDEFVKAMNSEKQMITVKDDDIIMDGNSLKQISNLTAMWQLKVENYFHLLQSEIGDEITETFEEITEEFPESIVKKIVEEIEVAIKPTYKDVKKN